MSTFSGRGASLDLSGLNTQRKGGGGPLIFVRADAGSDDTAWTDWTGKEAAGIHAFGFASGGSGFSNNIGTWSACLGVVNSLIAARPGRRKLWTLPLCTNTQSLAETAAGTHDSTINSMLDAILADQPFGDVYIRIGHEHVTPDAWCWTVVRAGGAGSYVPAWQHFADLAHAKSARCKMVYCPSAYNFDHLGNEVDPTLFYPGDAYVDVWGIDAYMVGADVSKAVTFARASSGKNLVGAAGYQYGITYQRDFARARGLPMSFDEWGIGAERPDYIRDMAAFINDPANGVIYHGYWNKNAPAGSPPYPFPCRLTPDGGNDYPLSKAAFLKGFYGQGAAYTERSTTGALFGRVTTVNAPAVIASRTKYNTLIATLIDAGLIGTQDELPALDWLYILGAPDSEMARIGLNMPGGFSTTVPTATGKITVNGSVGFTANQGYAGDGIAGSFLNLNFNPTSTTPAGRFALNSAHLGLFAATAVAPAAQQFELGSANSAIGLNTSGTWVGRPNMSSTVSLTNAGVGPGHVVWNRTGAASWDSYFNGVLAKSGVNASTSLTNASMHACGINGVSNGTQGLKGIHGGPQFPQPGVQVPILKEAVDAFFA